MNRYISIILLCVIAIGVVGAAPNAQNGGVNVDNGTIEITSQATGDDDLILVFNDTDRIRYAQNEDWSETHTVVTDKYRMRFEESSVGDSALWNVSNVTVKNTPSTRTNVSILNETENRTLVGLETTNNTDGVVRISSDKYNDVGLTHEFTKVEIRDISNNTTIQLEVNRTGHDSTPYIEIEDLPVLSKTHVRNSDDEVVGISTTGTFSFDVRKSDNYTFYKGTSVEVGNFTVDPILHDETIAGTQNVTVTYNVENTGNNTESINISSNEAWIETNTTSRNVAANSTTEIDVVVNGSKLTSDFSRSYVTFKSNGTEERAYIQVTRDSGSAGGGGSGSGVSLPFIGNVDPWFVVVPLTVVLSIIGPVSWVIIKPDDEENVFL